MKLRIAGIVDDSIVDGDGCRLTVFVQGCHRRCKNCQNPETQSFEGGTVIDTADVLRQAIENPLLTGVTFSGGEPFCQPRPLTQLARALHSQGLDIWSYSGYTLEQLRAMHDPDVDALLAEIDVLVDGEYIDEQRDLTLPFRGSANQRVIDMRRSSAEQLVLKYAG